MITILNWIVGVAFGIAIVHSFVQRNEVTQKTTVTASSPIRPTAVSTITEQFQKLPISESLIAELERDCSVTPCRTEVALEAHGWRIVRLADNSALFRAGFHTGDLIPNARIDESLAAFASPNHRLAQRTVRILNRLSQ